MKLDCGLSKATKDRLSKEQAQREIEVLRLWQPWFAWFPVRLDDNDCRWLETVERRHLGLNVQWDYGFFGKYEVVYRSISYRAAP